MDAATVARLEGKLDQALHGQERRDEHVDARLCRFEEKLDEVVRLVGAHDTRLAVAESKHKDKTVRKNWVVPSIATIGATLLNALLTAGTFFASSGHHG